MAVAAFRQAVAAAQEPVLAEQLVAAVAAGQAVEAAVAWCHYSQSQAAHTEPQHPPAPWAVTPRPVPHLQRSTHVTI